MPHPVIGPPRGTHPLIWCLAIICTIFTVLVIITGIVVFVGYVVIRPKVPFIRVTSAYLEYFNFTQEEYLSTGLSITIKAENDNQKAGASFSDFRYDVTFHGLDIARLEAAPFDVSKNASVDLMYVFESKPIPLDSEQMSAARLSLKRNVIAFNLKGSSRARWRIGPIGSVRFWCHLNCQLLFQGSGSSASNSHCSSSKSE